MNEQEMTEAAMLLDVSSKVIEKQQKEIERLTKERNQALMAMAHTSGRLEICSIRGAEREAEIERLQAEVARLKEIEIKYDQLVSGAFI